MKKRERRLRRLCGWIAAAAVLLLCVFPASAEDPAEEETEGQTEEQLLKARAESFNGIRTIGGNSFFVYAQNSPEWAMIHIGLDNVHIVRDSACASFALANAIVNSVPYSSLSRISELAKLPIRIADRTVSSSRNPEAFEITLDADYMRYFPLCIVNIAARNNTMHVSSWKNMGYYDTMADLFGLRHEKSRDLYECLETVKNEGALVIVCSATPDSPIAPNAGHFFIMAGYEDGKIYFLDSFFNEVYRFDRKKKIQLVEPGLFYVEEEDLPYLHLIGVYYKIWPNADRETWTAENYARILEESNAACAAE